jgi:hypothetical protein
MLDIPTCDFDRCLWRTGTIPPSAAATRARKESDMSMRFLSKSVSGHLSLPCLGPHEAQVMRIRERIPVQEWSAYRRQSKALDQAYQVRHPDRPDALPECLKCRTGTN